MATDNRNQHNQKRTARVQVLILILASILSFSCDRSGKLVEEAKQRIASGHYEIALNRLLVAIQKDPSDEEAHLVLGKVLSLRRVSIYHGIRMMEEAFRETKSMSLRKEILIAYLDLGDLDRAKDLIAPDRFTIEEFFSDEVVLLRTTLSCLSRPDEKRIQAIKELPRSPQRDYFLGRCIFERFRQSESNNRNELLSFIGSLFHEKNPDLRVTACRLTVLAGDLYQSGESKLPVSPGECKKEYPEVLDIARQRGKSGLTMDFESGLSLESHPDYGGVSGEREKMAKERSLFPDEFEIPPYPTEVRRPVFVPSGPDISEESYESSQGLPVDHGDEQEEEQQKDPPVEEVDSDEP